MGLRIAIVEDQLLFLEFLVMEVERLGHTVAATATDGETALHLIREAQPDLVILDILIPKISGIQVARILMEEFPRIRILALSSEMDPKTVHQVRQLQVPGFIDKNEASVDVLAEGLRELSRNRRFYSDSVKRALHDMRMDPVAFQKILSPREQEVLIHIGGGRDDAEIAERLGLSQGAVQTHRRNLFRKLDVHSTPELIRFAQEAGFWKASFNRMDLDGSYHLDG